MADASPRCFITGVGRAVAGVEGVPGLLVDHRIGIDWLIANGVCNPMTGKPLREDWAERNLVS